MAVKVGGDKGAPLEIFFVEGKTLEIRAKLVAKGNPTSRLVAAWAQFTPDGKHFVTADGVGDVLIWDVATRRLERTLSNGGHTVRWLVVSPDSKTLALVWAPYSDKDQVGVQDPQDLPQPRVSLFPVDGSAPPLVLIAPHGFITGLAFSPDNKLLALGSTGAVHLFDVTKEEARGR